MYAATAPAKIVPQNNTLFVMTPLYCTGLCRPFVRCKWWVVERLTRMEMLSCHWPGRYFMTGGQFDAGAAKIGVALGGIGK